MVQIAEEFERPRRGWHRADVQQLMDILNAEHQGAVESTFVDNKLSVYWFSALNDSYSLGEGFQLYPNEYLFVDATFRLGIRGTGTYAGTITIP